MSDAYITGDQPAENNDKAGEAIDPLEVLLKNAFEQSSSVENASIDRLKITLSPEQQKEKMNSIAQIFLLEEDHEDDEMVVDVEGEDKAPVIDVEAQERRTEKLRGAMSALAQLWWAKSEQMDIAVEKIADGSRDPKWRIPIGESGILNFILEIFATKTLRQALKIHSMRLIGNSCADTDENRARIVGSTYLPSLISQLKDSSLLPFAIPVLYNICIDYEPAQKQASEHNLTKEIIQLVSSSRLHDAKAFLGYICKILDLMVTQPSDAELAPEETPRVLLEIAADKESPVDMEDFVSLTNTACSYLTHERFQKALVQQGALDQTLSVLVDSYTRFDSHPSIGDAAEDEDDAKALANMRSNFNQVLSDISALPEFQQTCPVVSPFTASLRRWLLSPQLQLQVCACIMLGNLARSDDACIEFVHTSRVHIPLITILNQTHDSQLLHASIGFLKNLALPLKNKEIIGTAGIFDILPRLWNLDSLQQIQFSSISLARQLTIGTFENVRLLAQRLVTDPSSPANDRTNISLLIALFDRTDALPTKMEISRLITSIMRVVATTTHRTPEQLQTIREKFFRMHPDIGRPLGFMVSQSKWPVVRSEGWFVFALMARYKEGAGVISDLMQDVDVFGPLVELLTGKRLVDYQPLSSTSSPPAITSSNSDNPASEGSSSHPSADDQEPQLPTTNLTPTAPTAPTAPTSQTPSPSPSNNIDRENALVLLTELLKNRGSEMAVMRRTLFEDLLRGGTEILQSYSETRKQWGEDVVLREDRIKLGLDVGEIAGQSLLEFS